MAGADILLAFNVKVHDLEKRVALLHDDSGDSLECSFVED